MPRGQKFVGHLDRLVERAARVITDIEEQPLHAFRRQFLESGLHLAIGVLTEIAHLDIAGRRVEHEMRRHGENVHFVANHAQRNQLGVAAAADFDLDRSPLLAAQLLHGLLGRPALGLFAVNLRDDIAAANTFFGRRRSFEHALRRNLTVDRRDGDAEAVIAPFLTLTHRGVLFWVEEARMRIERGEHAADGPVDETVGIGVRHVVFLDGTQRSGEGVVALGGAVVQRQCASAEKAPDQRRDRDREDNSGKRTVAAHRPDGNR